jgi:type I restriction enzyme S subunit
MAKLENDFLTQLRLSVEMKIVPASVLPRSQFRLDAKTFLSSDMLSAAISGSSETKPLSEFAQIFTVYIQSPILAYVSPFARSRPYMTTSELAEYHSPQATHVSLVADPRLSAWEIKEGNIVVSRSGRVGETYWVNRRLDGVLVGDSFRVAPRVAEDRFFIYAVLASSFARGYLSGSAYGSVVEHASLDQLRSFPVPSIGSKARSEISRLVCDAVAARDRSYDLLEDAQERCLSSNGLRELDDPVMESFDKTGRTETVIVSSGEMAQSNGEGSEYRLDAHYYNPSARLAVKKLRKQCPNLKPVREISEQVIMGPRFKRNYVESDHGTPFLSGKNIVQIRPTDLKHLSNTQTEDLDELLVKRNWILVTCSGTLGRTCFVWHNFEDYAASQHILRVVPDEAKIDAGYLYAFLSSSYGYHQILKYRHGSVIDEITDTQMERVLVPRPSPKEQRAIGDKVRVAYEKRAEALRLEDKAQSILMRELTPAK